MRRAKVIAKRGHQPVDGNLREKPQEKRCRNEQCNRNTKAGADVGYDKLRLR